MTRREWTLLTAGSGAAAQTVHDEIQGLAKAAPLAMRFQGTTRSQAERWQREFRAQLDRLLGPYAPPAQWRATRLRSVDLSDFTREELLLSAAGHRDLPIHLLVPRGPLRKRPAILAGLARPRRLWPRRRGGHRRRGW